MRAVICSKYGEAELLEIKEVDKPKIKENEILIKTYATTVASGDCVVRGASNPFVKLVFGLKSPRNPILGTDLSGIVEEVGEKVTKFKKGDHVFASTGMKFGGHAEYIALNEKKAIAIIPNNMNYEEGTALAFGGSAALHYLKKSSIRKGQKILIYGASGAVGTSAVQLAKYFETEVTSVSSGNNLELLKSLGADITLDYSKENFSIHNKKYDLIFDAVGKTNKKAWLHLLGDNGQFLTVAKGLVKEKTEDLNFLKELAESKKLKAVIDRVYSLEEIVEAYNYVETGRKKGNVVIQIRKIDN